MSEPDSTRPDSETLSDEELKRATVSGIRWVILGRVVVESVTFGSLLILARILTPADFGHAAVALVVLALANAVKGFGTALVQLPSMRREHQQAASALSLGLGLTLTALTIVLAPVVAEPIFGSETATLIQIVAPAFAIFGLAAAPEATIYRKVNFRAVGVIDASAQVVGSGLALGLAFAGLGAKALVIGVLAIAATSSLALTLASRPLILPAWRPREMRELLSYGTFASANSLVDNLGRNVDYAILGAMLRPADVGFYQRAYQIGIDYQGKLTGILLRVAFPIYSRTSSLEQMRGLNERIVRAHGAILLPLLGIFIAIAPELVPWLYGSAWKPAVLPSQILAVGGMAVALLVGWGPFLMATNRMATLFRWNLGALMCFAAVVFAFAHVGLTAVCIAVAAYHFARLLAVQHVIFGRLLDSGLRHFWSEVAPSVVSSSIMLAAAIACERGLRSLGAPQAVVVIAAILVAAAVYLGSLRLLFPQVTRDLTVLAGRVLPGGLRTRRREAARNPVG
jgi:O-antigen/teichoic acid export membrane protein